MVLKRAFNIFILAFYTFGTLYFPMGNFAMLKDLPEMYRDCKTTEDNDLTIFEFLTEHVSPIGQFIENVEHEPEEQGDKPHEPFQNITCEHTNIFVIYQFAFSMTQIYQIEVKQHPIHNDVFFASDHISKIFRPPIVT